MEKKLSRMVNRRRPPNLSLKASVRLDSADTHINRDIEDSIVTQSVPPIFASVHRPRHASISVIKRDNNQSRRSAFRPIQQNNSNYDLVYLPDGGDNENSDFILVKGQIPNENNAKQSWTGMYHNHNNNSQNQAIAVPIPQIFHQNKPNGSISMVPQQSLPAISLHVHQQQQLPLPPLPVPSQTTNSLHHQQSLGQKSFASGVYSRIPMAQQNFNQISKTATNLLNDIYEKHLLSQTTFENVTMLNSRGQTVVTSRGMMPFGDVVAANDRKGNINNTGAIGTMVFGSSFDGEFNLNNLQHKQQFIRNQQHHRAHYQHQHQYYQHQQPPNISTHHHIYQHQLHQKQQSQHHHNNHHQLAVLQTEPHQHLYESIDGQQSPEPNIMPTKTLKKRISGKIQRTKKTMNMIVENKQNNHSNQRKHVSGGNDENCVGMNYTTGRQHPSTTPYNFQQRTRADGGNFPNDTATQNNVHSNSNNGGLMSMSLSTNPIHSSTHPSCSDNIQDENPEIRGIPIGSAGKEIVAEGCPSDKFPEHYQEFGDESNDSNIAKYCYRNSKIDLMLETAQAMAAATYYARAAQKVAQSGGASKSRSTEMTNSSRNGGYCGALQRAPPPMPAGLARRLANKENYGIGRVKVMLRVSDNCGNDETPHFMAVDKKKRQVTLTDPTTSTAVASTSQERGPMVAAPKMFAFDGLFTADDQQSDVCASALSEVIPAVLEGSDGCLLTIGYPSSGQSRTMLGTLNTPNELGAIPCAISWLYKGINERRQKSGARFSVRVSALGVSATKPDSTSKDLLAAHATDSDDSPGVYLRDDFLGGPTELRAPTAERAALFLDAALAGRPHNSNNCLEPAMIFTLHVYQYSLSGKGGVAGGRSRLHLIDLGGCANRNGGLPLSGIGNILLAILSGQRHPPNKDHPLTPLLKDCLAPLTCHVTILAHVSHKQTHTDALTTIQLASRIHRMRRRKHRFPMASDKALGVNAAGHQSGGSSEGPDPSSSDLSADTVIYMGPSDDATDGEHPPVYLPSLSSGDNRCAMSKVLKGSGAEKPTKIPSKKGTSKPQSPVITQRNDSFKRANVPSSSPTPPSTDNNIPSQMYSPVHSSTKLVSGSVSVSGGSTSPKIVAGALRHTGINKGSNVPTPKSSPLRRPNPDSPKRQISEEQWIDGPRVSRSKVAEARHLLREINHVKQCETWIDGPKSAASNKPLTVGNLPSSNQVPGYGFMDSHKKTMIRQWVENQSSHVFQSPSGSPTHQTQQQQQQLRTITYHLTQFNKQQLQQQKSEDDQHSIGSNVEMVNPFGAGLSNLINQNIISSESSIRSGLKINNNSKDETDIHSEKSGLSCNIGLHNLQENQEQFQEEEDQDSGPSEVPPALPLIEPLGSREISHESLHRIISRHVSRESLSISQQNVQTIDCGLQVTEEEIAKTMGCEHPLAALSHGDISVVSSFNIGDAFSDCPMGDRTRNQFDQLARLREIFTSQLAMAEVTPAFRIGDAGSVYSEPAFRFNAGPGSVCSEPAYRPPSPRCRGCRQSLNASRTPSQTSLPSLNGIMTIAGMEQYASLRHPDGASDPNLQKTDKLANENDDDCINEKSELLSKRPSLDPEEKNSLTELPIISQNQIPQLPLLPLSTSEAYDSGHDSSTPRTSKHSGISRRAESGYHSVATARDSDESSFTSGLSKEHHNRITMKKKRQDKSLCNWLRNPFTCTYPETEGEISDF